MPLFELGDLFMAHRAIPMIPLLRVESIYVAGSAKTSVMDQDF